MKRLPLVPKSEGILLNRNEVMRARKAQQAVHWARKRASPGKLRNLKLPGIDLSQLEQSSGCRIDGILGVELLEKLGITIYLKRHVVVLAALPATPPSAPPSDIEAKAAEIANAMHHCKIDLTREQGLFQRMASIRKSS